ncbi:1-acyl-sn-glycerol-3-phosphate acyltransferase [Geosmithia morbida]|uniref:1-acyl-sn-glycerol-3-phosphate acyltransferase n=1 Tax=Geosmithia morbida TaxID=1094350 RepID=A0A9P4YUA8_9HYPO|nr:1-acyl-sn-glycerol-3-phosphate acyltransferase [Geosmithia morbida]KAF4121914.1 1-acyl-sn-glycerol-3-phosphate acyltransferase [Geosmithia morbida]
MASAAAISDADIPGPDPSELIPKKPPPSHGDEHPSGKESFGLFMQIVRGTAVISYFTVGFVVIHLTQFIGAPLYIINRDWFYAYMAMTKRLVAVLISHGTNLWVPIKIRISGDESVASQIRPTEDGNVRFHFPKRVILIANHQIYTDWLYLWWVAYANNPGMHGHIYIILKESLKHIPIGGWGMRFFGFIWMSRRMDVDQPRLAYRLQKLRQKRTAASGRSFFNPMWLLLFPEGTTLSQNSRNKSASWAKKKGLRDPEHALLPRSTGMYFCLKELKGSVDYVYDCTVAYEGVPRGKFGEDLYGLITTYFQGRTPKSANMYWRRFRVEDIPLDDQETFDEWLREEWYKKDAFLEGFHENNRLPPMVGTENKYVETAVRTRHEWEIFEVYAILAVFMALVLVVIPRVL